MADLDKAELIRIAREAGPVRTDFERFSQEAAAAGDLLAAYRLALARVEAEPESADGWYELGVRLEAFKKHEAAAAAFSRADRLRPGHHETLTNLGLNLGLVGRFAEALVALEFAVATAPDRAMGYFQLAQVLHAVGQPSLEAARRAVELAPDLPIAHLQLAFSLMTSGKWLEGFREFEWRFRHTIPAFLNYPYPLWRGEETGTLVIEVEQGLGDAIMMMRYVGLAAARVEKNVWLVHKEMYELARRCVGPQDEVIPIPAPMPMGDAFIPMMSLPVALEIEQIGWPGPYITARNTELHSDFRVGIAWAGSPTHQNAVHRDMPLTALLPLAEIPGVSLYSLQLGPGQLQMDQTGAHGLVHDLSGRISSLWDTAQLIAGLDLVISVDTVVAHLAGAMGRPVFMIVNQRARDWRWGRWETKTPWYPSMRIFPRQIGESDWDTVVKFVCSAVRDMVDDQGYPF